jgi:hypothetical protein
LSWQGRQITLHDPTRLALLSGFSPRYLHLPRFALGATPASQQCRREQVFAPSRQGP